jgi:hypothetical protein
VKTLSNQTTYSTAVNVSDALAWIKLQTTPWWATVAMNAAHTQDDPNVKYIEPPTTCLSGAITGPGDTVLYHQTLECADYYIGTLVNGMSQDTLANTTIIFMGDNGTSSEVNQVYSSNRTKSSVYQGGVHVPLIIADGASIAGRDSIRTGKVVSPGRTVSSIVSTVDVFQTIADITGATTASSDSVSLVSYLNSATASAARTYVYTDMFSYSSGDVSGLTGTTLAEVLALTPASLSGAVRTSSNALLYTASKYVFYDLSKDPFEQSPIACATMTAAQTIAKANLVTELQRIDANYPAATCP